MSATVFFDSPNEIATVTNTFLNGTSPADPTNITCIVTDPAGGVVTHSYLGAAPADITRTGTGVYSLNIACSPSVTGSYGLWTFVFVGTGAVQDAQPGTFRTFPLADAVTGFNSWYCGLEELKSRLSIAATDTASDYEMILSIQTVTDWITSYCGQHFYQVTEVRTFVPYDLYQIPVDPLVSVSSLDLDYSGSGVYDTHWVQNVNFQLLRDTGMYNINARGIPRPYTQVQVIGANSGGPLSFFPYIWAFTPQNRVQITGTWGWPVVPPNVAQAALILAADLFKSKDAPWGVAGVGDLGLVKVQSNPWVVELLRSYVNMNTKAGV